MIKQLKGAFVMYDFSIGVLLESFRSDIPTALKKASSLGVQGIQVYATKGELSPEKMSHAKRREFLQMVKDHGLVISALCGDLGHGFGDKEKNPELIERSKRILELAKDLETNIVTTHIGVVPADPNHPRYGVMQQACFELAQYADSLDAHFAIDEEGYQHILEEFPECTVCKVHGKMKAAEKDEQMQLFISGKAQIMVATTVIEVGVNVPNASVMIIENAERFGLSQLHQLRGRVGRGADQSYCILVTTYKLTEETRKRLEIMVQTNDGFEIAEADLKLRGPGDLEGTQQSGVAFDLKIADIARDGQLLQYVREVASRVVDEDPTCIRPENAVLWQQLQALRKTNINWAAIS